MFEGKPLPVLKDKEQPSVPTVWWMKNGKEMPTIPIEGDAIAITYLNISDTTASTKLTFNKIKRDDEGQYWCTAKNKIGSNVSSKANITVNCKS